MSRRPALLEGVARALVLAPGVAPLAMLFGAAAAAAGLSTLQAAAFSGLVFAGAAQFAALALSLDGASALAIVALVGIINSRYLLLSTATLEIARGAGASPFARRLLALGVVDETYALQAAWARLGRPPVAGLLVIPLTLGTIWVGGTTLGAAIGDRLPDLARWGLDYSLPGIFVGLLGIFADSSRRVAAGALAVALGGVLAVEGFGTAAALLVPPVLALSLGRWAR